MLQKFKIIPCAFILCLFGLTLITVSPVFAEYCEYETIIARTWSEKYNAQVIICKDTDVLSHSLDHIEPLHEAEEHISRRVKEPDEFIESVTANIGRTSDLSQEWEDCHKIRNVTKGGGRESADYRCTRNARN